MKKITKKKIRALSLFIFKITLLIILFMFFSRVVKYPEMYCTTLRYQLKNDLINNDADAWTYYENTYLANGVMLYQDI